MILLYHMSDLGVNDIARGFFSYNEKSLQENLSEYTVKRALN